MNNVSHGRNNKNSIVRRLVPAFVRFSWELLKSIYEKALLPGLSMVYYCSTLLYKPICYNMPVANENTHMTQYIFVRQLDQTVRHRELT